MPKNPHADFSPVLDGYSGIGAFRFWCQTALPLTYDDSLSYYELLCKVVNYLNHAIEDLSNVEDNTGKLAEAYTKLQDYVNEYFDKLDIEEELRNVLDTMAQDGTLDALLDPLVIDHLPGVVDEKIDNVVADQIGDAVAGQIDGTVAEQLPAIVEKGIPEQVTNWLTKNVDPVGSAVVVDSSLTISGAAADAKVTGDSINNIITALGKYNIKLYENYNGRISSDLWEIINKYYYVIIPVNAQDIVTFAANNTYSTNFAVLRSYTTPIDGQSPDFSTDPDFNRLKTVTSGEENSYTMPNDANYLYVKTIHNNNDASPIHLIINDIDYKSNVYTNLMSDYNEKIQILDNELTLSNSNIQNINNKLEQTENADISDSTVNGNTGAIVDRAGYARTDYILYLGGDIITENIRCGATFCGLAFFDMNKEFIQNSAIRNITEDITVSEENIPSNCVYIIAATTENNGKIKITMTRDIIEKRIIEIYNKIDAVNDNFASIYNDIDILNFQKNSGMQFGAHRGAEYYAPENSIPAYEIAGKQGWKWAWIAQIKVSADGTLYVMHDNTVDRTTNGTGTVSELTDAYINGLSITIDPETVGYSIGYTMADYANADMHVPTLEEVIQICKRYGMKMCFRVGTISSDTDWNTLKTLCDEYNIKNEDMCIAGNQAQMLKARTLFGESCECSIFSGAGADAQTNIDNFTDYGITTGPRSCIISKNVLDLSGTKLLHRNNIKVYAYGSNNIGLDDLALWGVDVYQNGRYYYLPWK